LKWITDRFASCWIWSPSPNSRHTRPRQPSQRAKNSSCSPWRSTSRKHRAFHPVSANRA
jgi:hypothetical protein